MLKRAAEIHRQEQTDLKSWCKGSVRRQIGSPDAS